MRPETSSTSPASRLKAWQSAMLTPPGLSTKKRSTQRRPSRFHSASTKASPWETSTGATAASPSPSHASPSIAPFPPEKKVGSAHFRQNFSISRDHPQERVLGHGVHCLDGLDGFEHLRFGDLPFDPSPPITDL